MECRSTVVCFHCETPGDTRLQLHQPRTACPSQRGPVCLWLPSFRLPSHFLVWRIRTLESRHDQTQASGPSSTLLEPRVRVWRHLFPPKLRCRVAPNLLEQPAASRTTSVAYFVRIPATLPILLDAGNLTLLRVLRP